MLTFQFRVRIAQAGAPNLRITVGEQAFFGVVENLRVSPHGQCAANESRVLVHMALISTCA